MAKKILLGLTTITEGEWRNKIKEIDELGLKEIALFPTCLNLAERKELYQLLEETKLEKILHVHLREEDFGVEEVNYLINRYSVKAFNIHPSEQAQSVLEKFSYFREKIFVENLNIIPDNFEQFLKQTGGICLDLSHWEAHRLAGSSNGYDKFIGLSKKYKIGVNHISVIKRGLESSHWLSDLSQLDYVKKYKNYLADIMSIELENPLKRQLEVKRYLEKILEL